MSHDYTDLIKRLNTLQLKSCLEAADAIEAQAAQINALHRRAQQAEAACAEKVGSADGSLGRALANATANHWRAWVEAQNERIAELEQRSVMLATENTDLREPLSDEQIDAACKTVPAAVYELMHGHEITMPVFRNALREVARAVLAAAQGEKT